MLTMQIIFNIWLKLLSLQYEFMPNEFLINWILSYITTDRLFSYWPIFKEPSVFDSGRLILGNHGENR